ncbi:V0/A0 complex, 116-kDa subunit of ATPase [Basidiobolus meristosporus CBS 931.73]|uniref:V-type proton ATPase subunit a n=1 Tax=Basidiobolus meristosporus CBS 931.73 TaxID=1314790 RepID=A0A1Y1Y219_9FUNG|nr:V0/A0 complex, 116-kDa subunit of ATPase [Basidiobolus meristosporus CBS 931.73]|eukprot:ORX91935.1 V0/A0 complex, 116-kDa subunit of ATPase [Basidiobolus meristosporus CBS 931.73]
MSLVQLFIPAEVAQPTVSRLGELGAIQFRDLNSDTTTFQRAFVKEIRKLDEIERKLRFLSLQCEKLQLPIQPAASGKYLSRPRAPQEIVDLEETVFQQEGRVLQMNSSHETLQKRLTELLEVKHIVEQTNKFFREDENRAEQIRRNSIDESSALLQGDVETGPSGELQHLNVGFISGVIARSKINVFERILWRALRGNLYMNYAEIHDPLIDPETEDGVEKNVFIIFAHGQEILNKIRRVSESMGATLYSIEENAEDRRARALDVANKIEDLNNVLYNINQTRRAELTKVAENLATWMTIVKKEKAVYDTMNRFIYDANRKCLIAEGWCPSISIDEIQEVLRADSAQPGGNVGSVLTELHTTREPPTYHRTNKFTEGFQNIVDAYGVARYKEVNPGLFTIITFPFLFAVMFGDLGHGMIMTCFGLYLCLNEKKLKAFDGGEMFGMVYGGRYLILLMGFFSMFTGLIYNDIFSQSLAIFQSGWVFPEPIANEVTEAVSVGVYPFGLDPAWHGTDNFLIFTNSYKMKMSVIFGIGQMTLGIILTIYNYKHFNKEYSIWAEFVPQILFLESIFGYLVLTILYKWSIDWFATDANGVPLHNSPPSLLNMLIYMFLSPGNVDPKDQLFPGQGPLQFTLLLIALVCVPWMLFTKPYILKREHDKIVEAGYAPVQGNDGESDGDVDGHDDGDKDGHDAYDFADIMVHQAIHTIEFCLNCISNTASYLRLWALSLAHAQLSEVLWDMTLAPSLMLPLPPSLLPVSIVIGFAVWFSLTVSILLCMEGLSAFLHALRLHWVEFNGKFYQGTGVQFEPFSFKRVLENAE